MKTYRIVATIREGIRDNQGIAVHTALTNSLGFTNVDTVRISKTYTVTVENDVDIEAVAKGLINEVMENYTIEELNEISPLAVPKKMTFAFTLLQGIQEKIRRAFTISGSLLKEVRVMKYTVLGFVFIMVSYVSAIEIPTSDDLFICAGINQVYYNKILGQLTKMHEEVEVYFRKAVKMQPESEILSLLAFQEGMYQAKVLNPDQLVSEIKRCQKLL